MVPSGVAFVTLWSGRTVIVVVCDRPKAPKGQYKVQTNYYASHQDSARTGSTSAIVWTITNLGSFGAEGVKFASVRLRKHKQRQQVLEVEV